MNILVTAIGSMSAEAVISALCSAGHRVIGCDIHPGSWLATAPLVDEFYQAPYANDASTFIRELNQICSNENIDVILPLTDPEVDVLAGRPVHAAGTRTQIAISSLEVISTCRDKWLVFNSLADHAVVKVIPTIRVGGLRKNEVELPAIAKPRCGRSSEGLLRLAHPTDIDYLLANPSFSDHVVQPFLTGDHYTVDVIRHPGTGRTVAVARMELIRSSNGAGLTVEIVDDAVLGRLASSIAAHFGLVGCVNIEFLRYSDEYYLMDINPRFSAGLAFSLLAGYDMVANHLRCFFDDDIDTFDSISPMLIGKRYQDILLIDEKRRRA